MLEVFGFLFGFGLILGSILLWNWWKLREFEEEVGIKEE